MPGKGKGTELIRSRDRYWIRIASVVALSFGLLTIWQGGMVLFGSEAAAEAAGQYVPFVVWFNFLAGFAYVIAALGLWFRQRWANGLAFTITAAILTVFGVFGVYIAVGGSYEVRTIVAMSLRSAVWLAISIVAYQLPMRSRTGGLL